MSVVALNTPLSIVFVPVSSETGSGEYFRCLSIAQGVHSRWSDASITFVINRYAKYADSVPFNTRLLPSSPTLNTGAVKEILTELKPDIVVFDNAGRSAQLRHARRLGCRIVYISRTPQKRRKAFRWRWLAMIDEHWMAFPPFIAGELGWLEQLKLRARGTVRVRYLGAIFPIIDQPHGAALRAGLGLTGDNYILVIPGGGGEHRGFRGIPEQFARAAMRIADANYEVLMIAGPNFTLSLQEHANLIVAKSLPIEQVVELLSQASLVVSNGGSTLLQALAQHRVCVSIAVAGDQPSRLRKAARAGLVAAPEPTAEAITKECLRLLSNKAMYSAIQERVRVLDLQNGVPLAVDALEALWRRGRT